MVIDKIVPVRLYHRDMDMFASVKYFAACKEARHDFANIMVGQLQYRQEMDLWDNDQNDLKDFFGLMPSHIV